MQIVGEPEKAKSREPLILLGLRLIIQVLLPLGSGGTPVQVQVLSPAPYYDVTLRAVRREKSPRFLGDFSLYMHQFQS